MVNAFVNEHRSVGTLRSTFELQQIKGTAVPFQNGIPYPSFEPQSRSVFSLGGEWKKHRFIADHEETMMNRDEEWIRKMNDLGVTAFEFDDQSWKVHELPLPENRMTGKAEINGAETYEDGVWYRREFQLSRQWVDQVVSLKCLGLSYIGDFWINGKYVGHHEGGYTPFSFEVTPYLTEGKNVIAVRVDNPPWTTRIDTVPAVDNDFFNYTGILQDIYLEAVESVQVARADIVTKSLNGELEIRTVLENRSDRTLKVTVKGAIYNTDPVSKEWLSAPDAKSICKDRVGAGGLQDKEVELSPQETKVLVYQATVSEPALWSIDEPHLYVLKLTLVNEEVELDTFHSQFGIRTISTQGAQILLNEEPVFLGGVARHEDWPGYGRAASWERIKSDFLKIKDLSVNMVRTAHYPNHVYTYIMLDRLGLTAMSEIPLWQFETHHYEAQEDRGISYQMWREMIFSQYNRPSVIMWSTQNESKDVTLRKRYNENLVKEVRMFYHDGRLITQSSAADQPGAHDESMECLDVAGWTMYFGIFHGSTPYEGTRDFLENAHRNWPDKPILNTEYGIWSNADKSFIKKQVEIYRDVQHALLEKATVSPSGQVNENGYVAGMDYWTAFDWYVNHNQFYQTMGMLHMDRTTEKPLYHHFVRDHKRLLKKTKGLGRQTNSLADNPLKFSVKDKKESIDLILQQPVDLSPWNYLCIEVRDAECADGFKVQLTDDKGRMSDYQTYGIHVKENFRVYVPLWELDREILSSVASVRVLKDGPRTLEVLALKAVTSGTH
ncbi:glycoside hydrolase family 2 protein [Fictibacillus fluitans]|uniref:Glycoside hydrolase family 2 TIM barrel-domain containing protein n=1 Tax=Fictibacillus fluitans TaxID=3058422 RepID=A0ABT8HQH3_9BACL|nr:glycoside hydrolase family 2 TIM barrel-domain containing protein [Fictibacillus sp. NE201]MDN4523008.1 glycoside hydrolase family 2 TIM barrel-domain containing protein [Fictibacillus sp. NE201]